MKEGEGGGGERDLIYQTNAFSIIQLVRREEEFVSISRK